MATPPNANPEPVPTDDEITADMMKDMKGMFDKPGDKPDDDDKPADPDTDDDKPADPPPKPDDKPDDKDDEKPADDNIFGEVDLMDGTPAKKEKKDETPADKKTDEEVEASFKDDKEFEGMDLEKAGPYKKSIINLRRDRDISVHAGHDKDKEIERLNGELEKRPTAEAHEELKTSKAAADDRLGVYDVEQTPLWKQKVSEPRADIVGLLKNIGSQYGVPDEDVDKVVNMNAKDRQDFLKEKHEGYLTHVRTQLDTLDRINHIDGQIRSKHPEVMKAFKAQIEEKRQKDSAGRQSAVEEAVNQNVQDLKSAIPWFTEVKGDDVHNEEVKASIARAQAIPTMPMDKLYRLATIGSAAQSYHNYASRMVKKNGELTDEINRMKNISPGSEEGGPPRKPAKGADEKTKLSSQDRMGALIDQESEKAGLGDEG